MSVLACNRYGCQNVMCDRYSDQYGCICHECFNELVGLGPEANIIRFMTIRKGPTPTPGAAFARFNIEFPSKEI